MIQSQRSALSRTNLTPDAGTGAAHACSMKWKATWPSARRGAWDPMGLRVRRRNTDRIVPTMEIVAVFPSLFSLFVAKKSHRRRQLLRPHKMGSRGRHFNPPVGTGSCEIKSNFKDSLLFLELHILTTLRAMAIPHPHPHRLETSLTGYQSRWGKCARRRCAAR